MSYDTLPDYFQTIQEKKIGAYPGEHSPIILPNTPEQSTGDPVVNTDMDSYISWQEPVKNYEGLIFHRNDSTHGGIEFEIIEHPNVGRRKAAGSAFEIKVRIPLTDGTSHTINLEKTSSLDSAKDAAQNWYDFELNTAIDDLNSFYEQNNMTERVAVQKQTPAEDPNKPAWYETDAAPSNPHLSIHGTVDVAGLPVDGSIAHVYNHGENVLALSVGDDGAYQLMHKAGQNGTWEVLAKDYEDPRNLLERTFYDSPGDFGKSSGTVYMHPAIEKWHDENIDRINETINRGGSPKNYASIETRAPKLNETLTKYLTGLSDETLDSLRNATRGISSEPAIEGVRSFIGLPTETKVSPYTGYKESVFNPKVSNILERALEQHGASLKEFSAAADNRLTPEEFHEAVTEAIRREYLGRRGYLDPNQMQLDFDNPLPEVDRYFRLGTSGDQPTPAPTRPSNYRPSAPPAPAVAPPPGDTPPVSAPPADEPVIPDRERGPRTDFGEPPTLTPQQGDSGMDSMNDPTSAPPAPSWVFFDPNTDRFYRVDPNGYVSVASRPASPDATMADLEWTPPRYDNMLSNVIRQRIVNGRLSPMDPAATEIPPPAPPSPPEEPPSGGRSVIDPDAAAMNDMAGRQANPYQGPAGERSYVNVRGDMGTPPPPGTPSDLAVRSGLYRQAGGVRGNIRGNLYRQVGGDRINVRPTPGGPGDSDIIDADFRVLTDPAALPAPPSGGSPPPPTFRERVGNFGRRAFEGLKSPWWIPGATVLSDMSRVYGEGYRGSSNPYLKTAVRGLLGAKGLQLGKRFDEAMSPLEAQLARYNAAKVPKGYEGPALAEEGLTAGQRGKVLLNRGLQKGINAAILFDALQEGLNEGKSYGNLKGVRQAGGGAAGLLGAAELASLAGTGLEALGFSAPALTTLGGAAPFIAPVAAGVGTGLVIGKGAEHLIRRYNAGQWGDIQSNLDYGTGKRGIDAAHAQQWTQDRLRLANEQLRKGDKAGYRSVINDTGTQLRQAGMAPNAVQTLFDRAYKQDIRDANPIRKFNEAQDAAHSLYNIDKKRPGAAWRTPTVAGDNFNSFNSSVDRDFAADKRGKIGLDTPMPPTNDSWFSWLF